MSPTALLTDAPTALAETVNGAVVNGLAVHGAAIVTDLDVFDDEELLIEEISIDGMCGVY
jgi:mycofactocin precursor